MSQHLRIYRFVIFVLAAMSGVLALDIHITSAINAFYFPGTPMRGSTWSVGGLVVLTLMLAIEGVVVLLPKALGWKR